MQAYRQADRDIVCHRFPAILSSEAAEIPASAKNIPRTGFFRYSDSVKVKELKQEKVNMLLSADRKGKKQVAAGSQRQ